MRELDMSEARFRASGERPCLVVVETPAADEGRRILFGVARPSGTPTYVQAGIAKIYFPALLPEAARLNRPRRHGPPDARNAS